MNEREPKISTTEIVFITPLFIVSDLIGFALVWFGLDDFFLLDLIRFPLSQIYLRFFKGINAGPDLVANVAETIPYSGAGPWATIGWLVSIALDRAPQPIAAAAEKVAAAAKTPTAKMHTAAVSK